MRSLIPAIAAALLASWPTPAMAGAAGFTIVNATGRDISELSIRRFGTGGWTRLAARPPAGGRGPVQFTDDDCAFDIQATLAGGVTALWSGVNLCEAKAVTLNRSESGALWVDYD